MDGCQHMFCIIKRNYQALIILYVFLRKRKTTIGILQFLALMTLAGFKVIAEPDSGQGDKADVRLLQLLSYHLAPR